MRNPYTNEDVHVTRPSDRNRVDYEFLGLLALGAVYTAAYFWPWWPWTPRLMHSGQAVGFLYFFLGGYAYMRARSWRADGNPGMNLWIALILVPVAIWDILSPFVLGDFHPVSIVGHLLGGGIALVLTLLALRGLRTERDQAVAARA